jgi:hypothetical protein
LGDGTRRDTGGAEGGVLAEVLDPDAVDDLDKRPEPAVGEGQGAKDPHQRSHLVHVLGSGVLEPGVALEHEHQIEVGVQVPVQRHDRRSGGDGDGDDHPWEVDGGAERDGRKEAWHSGSGLTPPVEGVASFGPLREGQLRVS